jgi:hypothetical protein
MTGIIGVVWAVADAASARSNRPNRLPLPAESAYKAAVPVPMTHASA